MIPLSEHLSKCAKSSSKKFSVFPFYNFPEEAKEQQRIIEQAEFISKYKTQTEQIANYMYHTCNVKYTHPRADSLYRKPSPRLCPGLY